PDRNDRAVSTRGRVEQLARAVAANTVAPLARDAEVEHVAAFVHEREPHADADATRDADHVAAATGRRGGRRGDETIAEEAADTLDFPVTEAGLEREFRDKVRRDVGRVVRGPVQEATARIVHEYIRGNAVAAERHLRFFGAQGEVRFLVEVLNPADAPLTGPLEADVILGVDREWHRLAARREAVLGRRIER